MNMIITSAEKIKALEVRYRRYFIEKSLFDFNNDGYLFANSVDFNRLTAGALEDLKMSMLNGEASGVDQGSKDIFVVPALGLFHQMNELNNPQNKDKQTPEVAEKIRAALKQFDEIYKSGIASVCAYTQLPEDKEHKTPQTLAASIHLILHKLRFHGINGGIPLEWIIEAHHIPFNDFLNQGILMEYFLGHNLITPVYQHESHPLHDRRLHFIKLTPDGILRAEQVRSL